MYVCAFMCVCVYTHTHTHTHIHIHIYRYMYIYVCVCGTYSPGFVKRKKEVETPNISPILRNI